MSDQDVIRAYEEVLNQIYGAFASAFIGARGDKTTEAEVESHFLRRVARARHVRDRALALLGGKHVARRGSLGERLMATAPDPRVTWKSPGSTDGADFLDESDVLRNLGRYAQTEEAARRAMACGPPRPLQAAAGLREAEGNSGPGAALSPGFATTARS